MGSMARRPSRCWYRVSSGLTATPVSPSMVLRTGGGHGNVAFTPTFGLPSPLGERGWG